MRATVPFTMKDWIKFKSSALLNPYKSTTTTFENSRIYFLWREGGKLVKPSGINSLQT
jgi:hypothetical protein